MALSNENLLIILGAMIIILAIIVLLLEIKLKRMLRGSRAKSFDESIATIETDLKEVKDFKKEVSRYLETVEKRLGKSVRGIGTVRFNPFKGTGSGGNQSFSSSLLTAKGDGVTFSTLYARDHVSVYAKPIKDFKSEFELTTEEKQSIDEAREKLKI